MQQILSQITRLTDKVKDIPNDVLNVFMGEVKDRLVGDVYDLYLSLVDWYEENEEYIISVYGREKAQDLQTENIWCWIRDIKRIAQDMDDWDTYETVVLFYNTYIMLLDLSAKANKLAHSEV